MTPFCICSDVLFKIKHLPQSKPASDVSGVREQYFTERNFADTFPTRISQRPVECNKRIL